MSALRAWLDQHGLGKYVELFAENDIGLDVLPDLTDADLKGLGMSLGDRRRILRAAASLDPTMASSEPAVAPRADERDAERRQLTVMFCDLVGSTELSQRLDPEDLREIIQGYQDCCTAVVARYEGVVAKYMGDGVLAYFGYPRAHEDDAERAVRAGLDIVADIASVSRSQAARLPDPLAVRVGIATGLVVVGDLRGEAAVETDAVVGETPNLAARLQGLAEPNTVVVAPDTHRLTAGHFRYRDLGERPLKGIARPVQVWQALGEGAAESRFEARHGRQLTPLVGREEEVALLARRWERAKEGEGQVAVVSGEPGIGKSRLCETLRARVAEQPHTRLTYQCSPHHINSAFYPVINQLGRAAGIEPQSAADEKLDSLEALLHRSSDTLEEDVPLLATLLSIPLADRFSAHSLDAQQQKEQTFRALVRQLEGLAAQHPVLWH